MYGRSSDAVAGVAHEACTWQLRVGEKRDGSRIGYICAVGVTGYRTCRDKRAVNKGKAATLAMFKDLQKLFCTASIVAARRGKGRPEALLVNVFRVFSKQNIHGHKCGANISRPFDYVE